MIDNILKDKIVDYGMNKLTPEIYKWERKFNKIYEMIVKKTKMLAEYDAKRFKFLNVKLNSKDKDLQRYVLLQVISTHHMTNWEYVFNKFIKTILEFHYIPTYEKIEMKGGGEDDSN